MIKGILPILYTTAGVVAAGGIGYVALDRSGEQTGTADAIVSVGESPQNQIASLYQDPAANSSGATETPVVEQEPALPLPEFTLLRVEPDGSAVIAGSGPANSEIILLDGDDQLAATTTGAEGDFVFVLDEPLPPGLHQLHLLARAADGREIASAAAGIVEVPQPDRQEEPTVLVTEAGEATRVLQKPEPEDAGPDNSGPETIAKNDEQQEPDNAEQAGEEAATEATASVTLAEEKAPLQPAVTAQAQESVTVQQTQTAAGGQEDDKLAAVEQAQPAEGKDTKPEAVPENPTVRSVLIEAADIEEENVYIAGTGEPNMTVNLYFQNELLGTARVLPNGAFLFEGKKQVEPGTHDLRADMVEPDGNKVVARAEVTLLHEPEPVAEAERPEPRQETASNRQGEPSKTATTPYPVPVVDPVPDTDVASIVDPAKGSGLAAASTEAGGAPAVSIQEQAENQVIRQVETGTQQLKTEPVLETAGVTEPKIPSKKTSETPPVETAAVQQQAKQAKSAKRVIRTGSAVIIRRGDNLWRVARRNYGDGIRYTTIFEANASQIRNPDLIYPGQVFKLPEDKKS